MASWRPLAQGTARDAVRKAIEDIACGLVMSSGKDSRFALHELALFFAYLERSFPGEGYQSQAEGHLEAAIERLAAEPLGPMLFGGFTGVAWVVQHLVDDEDLCADIDEALCDHVGHTPWSSDYDLIAGLVGFGLYARDRLPRPAARECLSRIVSRLDETAERSRNGVTWRTRPELLTSETRSTFPQGHCNLGLGHGVPGVIALLGEACASGIAVDKGVPLLEGAMRCLLSERLPEPSEAAFANYAAQDAAPTPARSAWCYGDPGVAAALFQAARAVHRGDWEKEALAIANRAARRPMATTQVVDTGLCHGSAGLMHIFHRLHQATGDEVLGEAACRWLGRTLELRREGAPIGGFPAWARVGEGFDWAADPSLLSGAPGVGLALLAAICPIEPGWDRLLYLSASAGTE